MIFFLPLPPTAKPGVSHALGFLFWLGFLKNGFRITFNPVISRQA